jgi:hypothetical protein
MRLKDLGALSAVLTAVVRQEVGHPGGRNRYALRLELPAELGRANAKFVELFAAGLAGTDRCARHAWLLPSVLVVHHTDAHGRDRLAT